MRRLLALLAPLLILAACCAVVHAERNDDSALTLDSGVPVGSEALQRAQPAPASPSVGHGVDLDWTLSVFEGQLRQVGNGVPTQIRLAFIPNGMSVSFALSAAQSSAPTVRFGASASSMDSKSAANEVRTYGTLYFYTALLPNLKASTRYYYQVDGDAEVRSFVTAKAAGDTSPFTVAVIGDMGLMNSANTMLQLQRGLSATDHFLHLGDISYADDFYLRPNNTYEGSWDAWQDLMLPLTSAAAYMTLPGNHEVTCTQVTPFLCPKHQQNMTAYRARFRMPSKETGGVDNLWYSYDYGLMHFIQINTETDFPSSPMGPGTYYNAGPFGDQLAWFEADLEAAVQNRKRVPWIVVSGHRPWYTSGGKCTSCSAAFEALMVKYDVDIYYSGHVHWYERLWPTTLNGVVTQKDYNQPKGIVYLVNGAAGNVEGHSDGPSRMPYTALVNDKDYGYGRMFVANSTAIQWQYLRAQDNSVADEIWIFKQH